MTGVIIRFYRCGDDDCERFGLRWRLPHEQHWRRGPTECLSEGRAVRELLDDPRTSWIREVQLLDESGRAMLCDWDND